MRRLLALVAAACLLVGACSADDAGTDTVGNTTSTSATTTSSLSATVTAGGHSEPADPVLADACAMLADADIDDIVRSAYETEGFASDPDIVVPGDFYRDESEVWWGCRWSAQTGRGLVTLQTPAVVDTDYPYCRPIDPAAFENHPAMPADVGVAGVNAHATWVPFYRLVAEMKVADDPQVWCFEYEAVGLRYEAIRDVGLRVGGALIDIVAHSTGEPTATDAMTPSNDAQPFTGTTSCVMTPISNVYTDEGTLEIREHFSCTLEASDERVTGTQQLDTVTVVQDGTGPLPEAVMWWAEQDVITTTGGTWRSVAGYGVVDLVGVHPMIEGVQPFNYGTTTYAGEGGYAGMAMTFIIAGGNESGALAGWIEAE